MKRLWLALGAFAVLMVLAWTTIDDQKFRLAAIAILAMFAVRTWSHHRRLQQEAEREGEDSRMRS
jgi:membrane protein implicated in regulation of membrane protease activity